MRRISLSPYPWLALALIVAPHSARIVLWALPLDGIYVDFRGGLLFTLDIPLALALLLTLVQLIHNADFRARMRTATRRLLPWTPFLAWAWASITWTLSPGLVAVGAGRLGLGLLTAWLVVAGTTDDCRNMIRALVLGGALHGTIALLQTVVGGWLGWTTLGEIQWELDSLFNFGLSDFRAYGLAVHPNNLAGYLLVTGMAWAALMTQDNTHERRFLGWLPPLLIGGGVLATASRAALVALAVVGPFILWRLRGRVWLSRRVVVAALLVGAVGLVIVGGGLAERLRLSFTATATERLTYAFDDTLRVWRAAPLTGAGSGNLMAVIAANGPTLDPAFPAHNVYVVLLGELGAVGLALFGVGVAGALWRARGTWALALVAVGIVSVFDYYWWLDYRSAWVLFVVVGLGMATANLSWE
jgi:hypothetical protein